MAKKAKIEEESYTELILSVENLQEVQFELYKVKESFVEELVEIQQAYSDKRRPVYKKRNDLLKAIPSFWRTIFSRHPALADLLSKKDLKIFKYMDSLDVEEFKDVKLGYSIAFVFKPNKYFEDKKLTKTFNYLDDGTTKITGTTIKWKDSRGGGRGRKRNKCQRVEESFFSWFFENQQSDYADGLADEVAKTIKEDLWPNPLKYLDSGDGQW